MIFEIIEVIKEVWRVPLPLSIWLKPHDLSSSSSKVSHSLELGEMVFAILALSISHALSSHGLPSWSFESLLRSINTGQALNMITSLRQGMRSTHARRSTLAACG